MWRRSLTTLVVCLATLPAVEPAHGQEDTLTLAGAIALAREQSPVLAASEAAVRAAEGRRVSAASARLPRLTADAIYLRFQDPPSVSLGPLGTFAPFVENGYVVELRLAQPLYTGGRITNAHRAADWGRQAAQASRAQADVEITAEVAHAFDDALLAEEMLHVALEAAAVIEAALEMAEEHYTAGTVARLDVLRAETRLASARAAVRAAESGRLAARERLATLVGREAAAPPVVSGKLELPEPLIDRLALEPLLAHARDARPDVLALRAGAEAQASLSRVARASLRPAVGLYLSTVAVRPELMTGRERWGWEKMGGVFLSWPLLDFGAARGEAAAAAALGERAHAEAAQQTLVATTTVRAQLRELERAVADTEAGRENVTRAERALQIARDRYADGIGTLLDVLEAQAELTQVRADLRHSIHEARSATIELRRAAGLSADAMLPLPGHGGTP